MSEELTPMDRMELWMSALNEAITNGTENSFMPYNRYELWMKKLCEAILAKDPADPDAVKYTAQTLTDAQKKQALLNLDGVRIVNLTDGTTTLAELTAMIAGINTDGEHVFFDVASIGYPLYLCTIAINYMDSTPTSYRLSDLVSDSVAAGEYDGTITLAEILAGASPSLYPLAINITTPPTKTTNYEVGESFDPTGMVVTMTLSDGSLKTLLNSDLDISPAVFTSAGTQSVTITYRGITPYAPTTTQSVTVLAFIPNTWAKWQTAVRTGIAADYTEVADDFSINENNVAASYDVAGIDDAQPADETYTHSLSLLRVNIFDNIVFDPQQYLFAVTAEACAHFGWSDGMPVGTYNIACDHVAANSGTGADSTYQFTTTKVIPIGGGIRHSKLGSVNTVADVLTGTFVTYGADRLNALESNIACIEGTGGTNLGTTTLNNPTYKSGAYINFAQRNMCGSGRWGTSWARQVANSRDTVVQFVPGTIWSRPASANQVGFLSRLDSDLLAVLGQVRVRYALSITDGYGYEDLTDYVTLATMLDVYDQTNNNVVEAPVNLAGTVKRTTAMPLFKDVLTTNADKIKTLNSSARNWWLSSTHPSNAGYERYVYTSGALYSNDASNSYGLVPCLHII